MAATAMPEPAGILFFARFASAKWFGIVSFVGGYLIRKEISDRLRDSRAGREETLLNRRFCRCPW